MVQVEDHAADQKSTEAALKSCMVHMSCPAGMARHSGASTFLSQPLYRLRASND